MAYKQVKKYGYRDSLEKGDPEKVIYGVDFDAEFEAIETAFGNIFGEDGTIGPDDPPFQDVVFQNRTEDQQVISKFTFTSEKLGDQHGPNRFVVDPATYTAQFLAGSDAIGSDSYNNWDVEIHGGLKLTSMGFPPMSMQYNCVGMTRSADDYIRWTNAGENFGETDPRWVVSPKLDVEGDLTVNGNIIIDGGSVVDPDGNSASLPLGTAKQTLAHDGDKWTATSQLSVDTNTGKVGIGTDTPAETLTVSGPILSNKANYASNQDQAYMIAAAKGYNGLTTHWGTHGYQHKLKSNSSGGSRITVDTTAGEVWSMVENGSTTFAGNVGIGMTPLLRDAKEQLAEWSGWIEAKLELEPSLDRESATLDVTDGAFEVLPTEDKLAEWMETRAAGDKLQVNGNISATGTVRAGSAYIKQGAVEGRGGAQFGSNSGALQLNNGFTHFEPSIDAVVQLGTSATRFKDAHFSGTVNAGSLVKEGGTSSQLLCADGSVVDKSSVGGSGPDLSAYYTKTESDNKYQPKGNYSIAGHGHAWGEITGKPSFYDGSDAVKTTGNQTVAGIKTFSSDIRCKANVYAYYGSDERLKDDIAPMPVGLIDAIDASTWKWKEDGRSSGGVIAQQLQEIGLDDWVREAPNGDLGVDYNALIGMLIAEVQDLKKKLSDV